MQPYGYTGRRYDAETDHRYSVQAITDDTGTVVERYAYTAYGSWTILDAAGVEKVDQTPLTPYGYTGRRYDAESQLWYFRARYFDAELGRFISRDPLQYIDGMSMYRGYFAPGGVDPFGLFGLTDDQREKAIELLREIACEEFLRNPTIEYGWHIYESEDGLAVTDAFTDNLANRVNPWTDDFQPRNVPQDLSSLVVIHSHPSSGLNPPSLTDIRNFLSGGGVRFQADAVISGYSECVKIIYYLEARDEIVERGPAASSLLPNDVAALIEITSGNLFGQDGGPYHQAANEYFGHPERGADRLADQMSTIAVQHYGFVNWMRAAARMRVLHGRIIRVNCCDCPEESDK